MDLLYFQALLKIVMQKTKCCFCDYTGTARSVKGHIPQAHPEIVSARRIVQHGRPPLAACELCGLVHDDIPRPGWSTRRRRLERPRTAFLSGETPPDYAGESVVLGNLTVPDGVTHIKGLRLWAEVPTRLKLTITDPDTGAVRVETFDVGPGYGRRVTTDD